MKGRLRRILVAPSVLVLAAATLAANGLASTSGTPFYLIPSPTRECNNVPDCLAVTGPWVVVPANGEATFLLQCPSPKGFLVGGTDARSSSSAVRVWFDGQLGSPISAPSTQSGTGAALLFHAATNNDEPGSFQPILGCISLKQLTPRSLFAAPGATPSAPPELRSTHVVLEPGVVYGPRTRGTSVHCLGKQKPVGSWTALAFFPPGPPDLSHISGVRIRTVVTGNTVRALISSPLSLFNGGAFPEVQIGAICES